MSPCGLLMLSSLLALAACGHRMAEGPNSGAGPVLESTPDAVTFPQVPDVGEEGRRYRLVVSFNSLASGTDPAAGALFARILEAQQESLGRRLTSVRHRWGREGEYSECFMLDELTASGQRAFVEAMRSGLQTDRAWLAENASCPAVLDPMGHRR